MNQIKISRNFGLRLKMLRLATGKSQLQVSDEIKMAQTKISYYERQDLAPKEEILRKFANYYGVDIEWFFNQNLYVAESSTTPS